MLLEVQPLINIRENDYKEVETKHRSLKKQQETIMDKLCEARTEASEEKLSDSSVKSSKLIFYIVVITSQLIKRRGMLKNRQSITMLLILC